MWWWLSYLMLHIKYDDAYHIWRCLSYTMIIVSCLRWYMMMIMINYIHWFQRSWLMNNNSHRRRGRAYQRLDKWHGCLWSWPGIWSNKWNIIIEMENSYSRERCFGVSYFIGCFRFGSPTDLKDSKGWVLYSPTSILFPLSALFSRWENIGPVLGIGAPAAALVNPQSPSFVSPLLFSAPHIYFSALPCLCTCTLIGLFRALSDLRTEIQNWQVWWQVWEWGARVRGWSTPATPLPSQVQTLTHFWRGQHPQSSIKCGVSSQRNFCHFFGS